MEILISDEINKITWRVLFSFPPEIHRIKLLIETYNDVMGLKYRRVKIYKKIPHKFIDGHYVCTITSHHLEYMKNQLLEKGIL